VIDFASGVMGPEALFKLAVEAGFWNAIVNLSVAQDLMDRCLIERDWLYEIRDPILV